MNNLAYLSLAVLSLFLNACDEDDTFTLNHAAEPLTVDEVIAKANVLATPALYPFSIKHHRNDTTILDTINGWKEFGPFTVVPTISKVFNNHHVILTPAEGYESGVYLCDVYNATAHVVLPMGALTPRASASEEGYSNYRGGAKAAGPITISTSTDSVHTIRTWSIVPKYDQFGHTLDHRPLPGDLTGVTFTYSYLLIY